MGPIDQSPADDPVASINETDTEDRGRRAPLKRGTYGAPAPGPPEGHMRPSRILAENIRDYRILRRMTQEQLAARMALLGHGWGRSVVSAIEGRRRSVTIDEVFGLAISLGATVGSLLDPSGPDRSRSLGLDVGLGHMGLSSPLPSQLGRMFAASRAVIRLVDEGDGTIDIDMVSDEATASAQELDALAAPLRKRLRTTGGA